MPEVFTIYNCGTAFNRQRLDELTANLADRTEGTENVDWMINDGPGSGPGDPRDGRAPKDARPISAHEQQLRGHATVPGMRKGDINPAFVTQVKGLATGLGWEENTANAVRALHHLARTGNKPRTVNLLGWSRGAITCHMIANAMAADAELKTIRTNVFAVDPVAGTGNNGDWDKGTIPATVNEYASVLMEDERRAIMKPTIVSPHGAGGSRHLIYPMPGAHDNGVMIHQGPVAEIVQHLAHNFLTRHGTRLRSPIRLAPEKLAELYAMVRLQLAHYRKTIGGQHGGLLQVLGIHRRAASINNAERDQVYVNHHHRTMFAAAYPTIANMLYAKGPSDYQARIQQLAGRWPATYKWLKETCQLG